MKRAEHSTPEPSAPHGAHRAATSPSSHSRGSVSSAPSVSPSVSPVWEQTPTRPCQRRVTSSGRALVSLLALGIVFQPANRAGAYSPQNQAQTAHSAIFKPKVAFRSTPATATPRTGLMPRAAAPATPQRGAAPQKSGQIAAPAAPQRPILRWAKNPSEREMSALFPAPPAAAGLKSMKKVIDVPALALPPLSKPLPSWMQNAAVRVEKLEKAPTRLAQNRMAAPVRNPGKPVTSSDRLANQIEVATSTFVVLLTTTDLQTVAVADPSIADVAVVNSRSVLLNGKTSGVTSLVIVDGQKIRQYTVRVTAAPGTRPVDVASAIGLPGVTVRPLRDALVLDGEVASAEEARRATEIAAIYAPKVVNQLSIRGQVSQEAGAAAQLRDLINLPNVNVRVSGDTAILTGTVETPQQAQDADTIARTASKNVINLLKLPILSIEQLRESLGAGSDAIIGSATAGPLVPGTFAAPAPLTVRQAGGSLILEGVVSSPAALDQILSQASRTGLPLLNRLQVPAAATADQGLLSAVAASIGRPGVRVSGTAKRLILEGVVPDTEAAVAVEQIARAFSTQVDNLLQTPNPRLVDIDVSIVEITKTGLKNLGFTFPSLLDASNSGFVIGQRSVRLDLPGALPPTDPNTQAGTTAMRVVTTQTAFQAALRAEMTNQDVRLLSNPRTTVLSGRTATFQVGGQVPVPVSITQSATGTITGIAFKDFGVLIDVVPNASANGAVTMRVKTEISQPDPSIGFTPFAGSSPIPGFTRRAAVTEVTTPAGGTVALGGLISNTNRQLVTKVPFLGNLPIIGSLFTSKRFQNDQTELVIFVTPRVLPNPLAPGTTAAAGVVAVGNTSNVGTVLGNPGLATGGVIGTAGGAP